MLTQFLALHGTGNRFALAGIGQTTAGEMLIIDRIDGTLARVVYDFNGFPLT